MIFVVSMHRSGSSLLTGLLTKCGVNAGRNDDLLDSREDNPKGFFERYDVVEVNRKIVQYDGYNANVPDINFDPQIASREFIGQLKKVSAQLHASGVDIIKDPRLCLTLPTWLKHTPDPIVIYLLRAPESVAASLTNRQSIPSSVGEALWEFYNQQAHKHIGGVPVFRLGFEGLVSDPQKELGCLVDWLRGRGVKVDMIPDAQISSFFDPALIHHGQADNGVDIVNGKLYDFFLSGDNEQLSSYEISENSKILLGAWAEIEQLGYCPERISQALRKTRRDAKNLREELKLLKSQHLAAGRYLTTYLNSKPGKVAAKISGMQDSMKARDPKLNPMHKLQNLLSANDDS